MAESLHRRLDAIRRERGELLKDMADRLELGSAELSAIEHAKTPLSTDF